MKQKQQYYSHGTNSDNKQASNKQRQDRSQKNKKGSYIKETSNKENNNVKDPINGQQKQLFNHAKRKLEALGAINQALAFLQYESNSHQQEILLQQRHDLKKIEDQLEQSLSQLYGDFNTLTLDHQGCIEKKKYYRHQYKKMKEYT